MQKLTILLIREEEQLVVLDKEVYPDFDLLNLPIVKNKNDYLNNPFALLHSGCSTPAKYVEQVLKKLKGKLNTPLFLVNPIAELNDEVWHGLLEVLKSIDQARCQLIAAANDIPIGIYIPVNVLEEFYQGDFVRYLSCVSATLDFSLLCALITNVTIEFLCLNGNFVVDTDFYISAASLAIYRLTTSHYLQARMAGPNQSIKEHIAVMPFHAGDVLFICLALSDTVHPFKSIMVNQCYADIVRRILPNITIYPIDINPIARGENGFKKNTKNEFNEQLYFLECVYKNIPTHAAFQYLRPSRNGDLGKIHLIDQWKSSVSTDDSFVIKEYDDVMSGFITDQAKAHGKNILIQFDSGWHLKIYPYHYQIKLVELLKNAGYRITVLSDKNMQLDVDQYIPFTHIKDLEMMTLTHAIFLGMDSFPSHFAAHILKHPSITLFSSTEPANADAPNSVWHKDLYKGLTCCPCRSRDICPINHKASCDNFVEPSTVFNTIETMYRNIERMLP